MPDETAMYMAGIEIVGPDENTLLTTSRSKESVIDSTVSGVLNQLKILLDKHHDAVMPENATAVKNMLVDAARAMTNGNRGFGSLATYQTKNGIRLIVQCEPYGDSYIEYQDGCWIYWQITPLQIAPKRRAPSKPQPFSPRTPRPLLRDNLNVLPEERIAIIGNGNISDSDNAWLLSCADGDIPRPKTLMVNRTDDGTEYIVTLFGDADEIEKELKIPTVIRNIFVLAKRQGCKLVSIGFGNQTVPFLPQFEHHNE